MGTINYGTTYYFYENNKENPSRPGRRLWDKDITIGLQHLSNFSDEESGYNDWLEDRKNDDPDFEESEFERSDYDRLQDEEDYFNVEYLLDHHKNLPEHYTISLENGYYEGFFLKIDSDIPWVFDDSKEKKEYLKDIICLKKVLLELLDNGLCVVYPGWCTGYADREKSIKKINEFVKNLRDEVKAVDTLAVYKRREKVAG